MRTATIYNFLLEANIMASLAILLMIPIRKFLRKSLGSRIICFAWLLVAIRLLCPLALPNPIIHEIRSPFAPDLAIRPIAGQIKVRVEDAVQAINNWAWNHADDYSESTLVEYTTDLMKAMDRGRAARAMMTVYAAGALGVTGWFIFANIRFRRHLRADRIEALSGEMMVQYERLCEKMHVRPLPIYFVDPLPSACLVGVFRPYIALPLSVSPQTALPVLTHEISHYKNGDHFWALLRLICCILHWFNPLVWLAANFSRTDMELACDERATRPMNSDEKKNYAGVLVLAATRRNAPGMPVLATGMTMTGKRLKTRVKQILEGKPIKMLGIAFIAFSCMLLLCAFATAEAPGILADSPISELGQYPYYYPGKNDPITSAQEAIDRAKALVQRPDIGVNAAATKWSASLMDDEGTFRVVGQKEDGYTIYLIFLADGSLWDIINWGPWESIISQGQTDQSSATDRKAAEEYLLSFMEEMTPGLVDKIKLTFGAETIQDGERYLQYDAYINPALSFTFVLQIEPEIRILLYSPGNG